MKRIYSFNIKERIKMVFYMSKIEKKYFLSYEEYEELTSKRKTEDGVQFLPERILSDADLPNINSIIVGDWGEAYEESCQNIIDMFVAEKDKFAHLESLFIGDMDYEECEVSWIIQGNYEKLYEALPNLKSLTIKGSTDLTLGKIKHDNLEHLEIICGGLPDDVIEDIANAELPNLKTLILYVGVDNYGFDGTVEDFRPLLKKEQFPKLTHLGLVDSEEEDKLVKLVLDSDILPQLEELQFSYGCLTDEGGQYILDNLDKLTNLKKLDLEYHYLSGSMMKKLSKLPFTVILDDQQEEDDEYKYPMLTE